ncbi:Beta-barrel assembly machine subunit BamA [Pacificibacter maritimus]|uniref:Outer membrane protein assembly factor BamA n=1 Tax=Pacificibacter maritimus TaxID=762213 RepID=A0A3N4ULJ4_9RHOB|nr:outer membrane protein assembly factor BamA [Pacificibacter maritimus]RPE71472.1 Beta-barrel assembly machine subunit BamA [Pacificibacter maritimus]
MRVQKRGFHSFLRGNTPRAFALSCAALSLGSTAYLAYPSPVMAQEFQFSTVEIQGNGRVSTESILNFAGIGRNQGVSGGELNDAYQRVLASGLFESVEFIPQGSKLLIKVTEFPTVSRISIEGNSKVNDDVLSSVLQTQVRRAYAPSTAEQDAAAMAEIYASKGQLAATVTPRIIRRNDNRVDVVFEVTEGKNVEVERLTFVGNRQYSNARLRRVLETKQAGLLRFLVGRDTFAEDRVNFDKQVLTDFYTSRGFIDFEVLNVAAEFSRERDAYFLTFNIREGQKFSFGEMTTVSEIDGLDTADFQKEINIRSGQTYSPVAVENAIERIEILATKKGIDFLRVEPRVTRNDRERSLDISFALVRGPRVFVERIDIEGNATTLDRVVRRQFKTVEGDPFNPREIREAASRIRALGFFSDARVDARAGSGPEKVIVDVDLEETSTGSFSFGVNYSVSSGANLIASFSESNFLGRGQRLAFNLTTKLDDGNLSFNFVEPAFLGRDVAFGLSANYGFSAPIYADHESRDIFVSPSLTFPVAENARLRLNYKVGTNLLRNPDDNDLPATIQADVDAGEVFEQSLGYTYSYDTRRSGVNPNAGVKFEFSQDIAGFGSDVEYLRTTATVQGDTTLFNEEVNLSASIKGGMIEGRGGMDTRVSNRFFTGTSLIRGFEPGGIGPRDLDDTELALGGKFYAVASLETDFPLGLPEEYGIKGGLFLDHGALWGLDDASSAGGSEDISWRTVVGASVFLKTPIGPLRFNFTKALNKEDYDVEQNFDLTIATQF